jgi:uncharacterized membrane protein (UPF0136 family)
VTVARLWTVGAALSLLDAATTLVGLREGHYEANPYMAQLMRLIGVDMTLALRVLAGSAAFYVAARLTQRARTWGLQVATMTTLFTGLLFTAVVVCSNLGQVGW